MRDWMRLAYVVLIAGSIASVSRAGAQEPEVDDQKSAPPVSFGFNLRERAVIDHAPSFGTLPRAGGEWLLSRVEAHADVRLGGRVQVFVQLQSAFAPGKPTLAPVDRDRLDVEQAFVGLSEPLGGGKLRVRFGRQLIPIELQRFISVREGPNLRQSYDAAYVDYERGGWRVTTAYTRPVNTRDERAFDDYSDPHLTLSGVLVRRRLPAASQLSVSYMRYTRDDAVFASAAGHERRNIVDVRLTGAARGFDWNVEAMHQTGDISSQPIEANAFGLLAGYSITAGRWAPHLGLGVDVATGDGDPHDGRLETFNPLFPNGYYLAGYTGYPNLIHITPAFTVHPAGAVSVVLAAASQWRQTVADAIYVFPDFPIAGTAGRPGRYTGSYGEVRADWTLTPRCSASVDAVHYAIGQVIREVGGNDANYLGIEVRYRW